jgi:hypothetical protein
MTDNRFTNSQSPRASRDSTQDPLEHARGTVPKDWAPEPRRNALGEGNEIQRLGRDGATGREKFLRQRSRLVAAAEFCVCPDRKAERRAEILRVFCVACDYKRLLDIVHDCLALAAGKTDSGARNSSPGFPVMRPAGFALGDERVRESQGLVPTASILAILDQHHVHIARVWGAKIPFTPLIRPICRQNAVLDPTRRAGAPISPQRATRTRGELLPRSEARSTVPEAPTTERD